MSANRLAVVVVSAVILVSCAFAQDNKVYDSTNEVSATFGRTFVSTQDILNANFFNHTLNFGAEETLGLNYSRLLKTHGIFTLSGEVPLAVAFDVDLNTGANLIPEYYRAFFVAPSARLNFFNAEGVSPWVSFGGGYAHFKMAGHLLYGGPNPGPTSTNTGVLQFGTGLDVFPWHRWGLRLEARDFWSGAPALNVDTGRSRQHNYYVGGGVIYRF
jgi:hypothetical protein